MKLAGTDLYAVKEYLFDENYEKNIVFSLIKLPRQHLNYLYNIADVQILLTSNEGWGLTITEAVLAGTPIIANVTGGMQDQMRFVDENGKIRYQVLMYLLIIEVLIKNMVNGHFQFIQQVDQFKVHLQHLISMMIDVNGKMLKLGLKNVMN